jgi:hypothetical protein
MILLEIGLVNDGDSPHPHPIELLLFCVLNEDNVMVVLGNELPPLGDLGDRDEDLSVEG